MSELDKKLQKSPTDLVQSVMEAVEKRSVERVDMLITNAFRQLKTTRFKPDQTICISLTYIARVCPRVFSQSTNLKELLKSHVKRDNGPANIKGTKNDYILPVLAANILLSCCDSLDVRSVILTRVEQWISSNQKLNELVQHLIAVLCVKCHDDPQTIKTLIEIRNHWYQFFDSNHTIYGPASTDLSRSIRDLLSDATSCESVYENLCFLEKHDSDIMSLLVSVSKLITRRTTTFISMLHHKELGDSLGVMLCKLLDKLFTYLESTKKDDLDAPLFIELHHRAGQRVAVEKIILEALLILLTTDQMATHVENSKVFSAWLKGQLQSPRKLAYLDAEMTQPLEIPMKLLQQLAHSDELQVTLCLNNATTLQMLELVQSFGLLKDTISKIFDRLHTISPDDVIKSGIRDLPYFNELMETFVEMGIEEARKLVDIDITQQDFKKVETKPDIVVKVKSEPV